MDALHGKKILKRITLALTALALVYSCLGFFLVPYLGKKILVEKLGQVLDRPVAVGKIRFNPYWLSLEISHLTIGEKEGYQGAFFAFDKGIMDMSLASFIRLCPVVSRLSLENPRVSLVRNPDLSFNFSDLVGTTAQNDTEKGFANKEKVGAGDPDSKGFDFCLSRAQIQNGTLVFSDRNRGKEHEIKSLELNLEDLSSLAKDRQTEAKIDLSFIVNRAETAVTIKTLPFDDRLDTRCHVRVSSMDLIHYMDYFPIPENLVPQSMNLEFDMDAHYARKPLDKHTLTLEGQAGLKQVRIDDSDGSQVLGLSQLSVTLEKAQVFEKQITLDSLVLESPELFLSRDSQGRFNLEAYLGSQVSPTDREEGSDAKQGLGNEVKDATGPKPQGLPQTGVVFRLAQGHIQNGILNFSDQSNASAFTTRVSPLDLKIANLVFHSGNQRVSGEYDLFAQTEAKEELISKGKFSHPLPEVQASVQLSGLDLKKYAPYYQAYTGVEVQNGTADLDSMIMVSPGESSAAPFSDMKIDNKRLSLNGLILKDRATNEVFARIPELKILESSLDLANSSVHLGRIFAADGQVFIRRSPEGVVNLAGLSASSSGRAGDESDRGKADNQSTTDALAKDGQTPRALEFSLASLDMEGYVLELLDRSTAPPARLNLSDIRFSAKDLGTAISRKGRVALDMIWNEKGRITARSDFGLATLTAGIDLDLRGIDIKSLEPYFTDYVKIMVTDGVANSSGRLDFELKSSSGPRLSYKGEAALVDFVSLDKELAKDFFKCKSLFVSGLDVSLFPTKVAVGQISLSDFYSRLIVSEKGGLNIKQVFGSTQKPPGLGSPKPSQSFDKERKKQTRPEISVADITLQGGHIEFSDYLTQPNFTANMKEITGSLKGLSSMDKTPGRLNLKGVHGKSSPLEITGTISPLTQKTSADINVSFSDIELAKFTPYSSKYLGYKIQKGKLGLDLNYRVDDSQLDSSNRLFFDQLTLGERTNSKDATTLPVAMAISLLKNREGQIDLDLPVKGDLKDPEFRFGSVVLKIITNLIVKVVTSPFSILGSMFEGGEKLGYVVFSHGRSGIDPDNGQKLEALTDILAQKKSLNLEIQGVYDPVRDLRALSELEYENRLKSLKLKQIKNLDQGARSLDDVEILPEERQALILAAYEEASFPKPKEAAGKDKQISMLEMEKLLITNIQIRQAQLNHLAMTRAEQVKDYILSLGRVERERLFLLEPKPTDPDTGNNREVKVRFSFK